MLTKNDRFDLFIDELYVFSFRNRKGQYGVFLLAFLMGLAYAIIFGVIRGRPEDVVAFESLIVSLVVFLRLYLGEGVRSDVLGMLRTSWHVLKWFFKDTLGRSLLGVGLVLAIYAAYRQQEVFTTGGWLIVGGLRISFSWLFGSAVVQSILGPLLLLTVCSVIYWLRIREQRFIVVSDFRVWGDLEEKFPAKGVAARLRDELMRLSQGTKESVPRAPGQASSSESLIAEQDSLETARVLFIQGGLSLPETHVTLQYEGISLEAFLTFVRRTTKREVVITGDLASHRGGLLLVARTTNDGPWEVLVQFSSLGIGLEKLALRIMTTLTQKFQPKAARAFAVLQIKARELQEYDLGFRLAKLASRAAPESPDAKWNLATAYSDIGVELELKKEYSEAIPEFKKATELNPDFAEAYEYLAIAYEKVRDEASALEALGKAQAIRVRQSQ